MVVMALLPIPATCRDRATRAAPRSCRTYAERSGRRSVGRRRVAGEELQRGGVEAVALTGRRRPVGKQVAEVAVAAPAADLDALHAVRAVAQEREVLGVERLVEGRPAGARLELGPRAKERQPAQPAAVHALVLVVQKTTAKRWLGAVVEQDPALLAGEVARQALALRRRQRTQVVARLRARAHVSR